MNPLLAGYVTMTVMTVQRIQESLVERFLTQHYMMINWFRLRQTLLFPMLHIITLIFFVQNNGLYPCGSTFVYHL